MTQLNDIFTNKFLDDTSKFQEYQSILSEELGLIKGENKLSRLVDFLAKHDIVIAPGDKNVGVKFTSFQSKSVQTIPTDQRKYGDIPGTFFAKNTLNDDLNKSKHIVYLNVKYNTSELTSINFFAHELGHAIDHVLGTSNDYFSSKSEYDTAYTESKAFFDSTGLTQNIKEYLKLRNESFAECFAFYRTKTKLLKDNHYYNIYYPSGNTSYADKTPNAILKETCPTMVGIFKTALKK